MDTKYPRKYYINCKKKAVAYKMPSLINVSSGTRIHICWECCQDLYKKLILLQIENEPDKKLLLRYAREQYMKSKINQNNINT